MAKNIKLARGKPKLGQEGGNLLLVSSSVLSHKLSGGGDNSYQKVPPDTYSTLTIVTLSRCHIGMTRIQSGGHSVNAKNVCFNIYSRETHKQTTYRQILLIKDQVVIRPTAHSVYCTCGVTRLGISPRS